MFKTNMDNHAFRLKNALREAKPDDPVTMKNLFDLIDVLEGGFFKDLAKDLNSIDEDLKDLKHKHSPGSKHGLR